MVSHDRLIAAADLLADDTDDIKCAGCPTDKVLVDLRPGPTYNDRFSYGEIGEALKFLQRCGIEQASVKREAV